MIGVFGGTFNPVHWGHVRTALELKNELAMDTVLMVPCGIPPHRDEPNTSPEMRLAMLEAAISGIDGLQADDRELRREGPSYTIDTLRSLRAEKGNLPIGLCVGVDAFVALDTWHQWQQLIEFAHIIVVHRPGWSVEGIDQQVSSELKGMIHKHRVDDSARLHEQPAGCLLTQKVTNIDISSSDIRQRIAQGKSIKGMVPAQVQQFIESNKLYQNTVRGE